MRRLAPLALIAVLAACEGPASRPGSDGGPAGQVADGGPAPDGGSSDGGPAPEGGSPDGGPAPDGGTGTVTPGCPSGSILGRACAPSGVLWLADAIVSVDVPDCAGQPVRIQAATDLDGFYRLDGVPAGEVTLHIRKGNFATSATVTVPAGGTLDLTGGATKVCFARNSARIAVLAGAFDQVEVLLDQLGLTYTWYDGIDASVPTGLALLLDPLELAKYDIVLINCGVNYWSTIRNNPTRWAQIVENVRSFVGAGGSLYVSDWSFKLVEDPFPAFIDFNGIDSETSNVNSGYAPQTVTGEIIDQALAHLLGAPTVPISFPNQFPEAVSNNWALMVGAALETQVLVKGDVRQCAVIEQAGIREPCIPRRLSSSPSGHTAGRAGR
jgi:hypothetical protein